MVYFSLVGHTPHPILARAHHRVAHQKPVPARSSSALLPGDTWCPRTSPRRSGQTCDGLTNPSVRVVPNCSRPADEARQYLRRAARAPGDGGAGARRRNVRAARPRPTVASYAGAAPPSLATGGGSRSIQLRSWGRSRRRRPRCGALPIVRDPAPAVRVKRAYRSIYRVVERVPFEHRDDPAGFSGMADGARLTERSRQAGGGATIARRVPPKFTSAWVMTWQALPLSERCGAAACAGARRRS